MNDEVNPKVTGKRMREFYDKSFERMKKREDALEKQRKLKEEEKERELKYLKDAQAKKAYRFFKYHKNISTKESPRFLDRMDEDLKKRLNRSKNIKKEKEWLSYIQEVVLNNKIG